MRAFGDGDARRHDVAIHRPVIADVDLVAGRDVPGHLAENDHRLREDLRLDPPVRADCEHVIAQLNCAFDVTFDSEILAAVELALDDDRFPNVHDVLLHVMARLWRTRAGPRRCWRGGLRRSRLSARRSDRFIAFPHVYLRLVLFPRAPGNRARGEFQN